MDANRDKKSNKYSVWSGGDDIPFAWRHIILVDKRSHAGRVITKIKQEIKSENRNLDKKGN